MDASPCVIWNGEEYSLVYNGELYNTQELRRELMLKGHRFHGHSDTEVLLHAYMQWGEQCVDRFNGIFALRFGNITVSVSLSRATVLASNPFSIYTVATHLYLPPK